MNENKKTVSFTVAVITLIIVAGIMSLGLAILKLNTMVTFILTFLAVCIIAVCVGTKLNDLEGMILTGFNKTAQVCMIFIAVGMVVGSWIISGIVPSIIYYGLKLFTPSSFLALGFVVSCVVSFFTGSSYAALGTMGIAFMAIGYGMEINPALVAGMAVSGAVFGDKMSPFSDTTTMAPAAAGTDVFTHIKAMLWTVIPAFLVALVLYFVLGLQYNTADPEAMQSLTATIVYTIFAIELGEIMYQLGVMSVMLDKIRDRLEKPANLIITTLLTCLATVMLTTSQYMAILLPGEVFQDSYKKAKVAPQILSRTLEDGGTLFAFLVPWSAAAIYSSGVLDISAVQYLPFAFLPLICPLTAIVCAITGIGVYDTEGKSLRGKTMKKVAE